MSGKNHGPTSAWAGGLVPGAVIGGLMTLAAALVLGWVQWGAWRDPAAFACLAGALVASVAFSFDLKDDGGTLFFLALPLTLLAAVLAICLMPDMVLAWTS